MAIVREGVTPQGARYRIFDDGYIDASPEEIAARRDHANRVAYGILKEWAQKHPGETYRTDESIWRHA